jgi:3-oxoacyl-[acyl-carrier protein] reductase
VLLGALLSEKTALVTGGGKGIGAAISRSLAAMGASVVIAYRSDSGSAEQVAHEIEGKAIQCDVSDQGQVERLIKSIGRVDVLVNNAGLVRDKLLLRMTAADWHDIIATDLDSAFYTTKAVLAEGMLRARWGRIVNMSSIVGITGNPGQANYAAAKAGLIGFTKAIAKEVGSRSITVNAVAPGYVRTELTSGSLTDEMVGELVKFTPLGREGTPEDVAAAVAVLCSPAAGFITGHVLVVDGGLSL